VAEESRSLLASIIGWVIVAIIAWFVLGFILGTIFWVLRSIIWIVVIGGLIWAYLALKAPKTDA